MKRSRRRYGLEADRKWCRRIAGDDLTFLLPGELLYRARRARLKFDLEDQTRLLRRPIAVLALEFPDDNLSGFVRPVLEQWRNVEVHVANMTAK